MFLYLSTQLTWRELFTHPANDTPAHDGFGPAARGVPTAGRPTGWAGRGVVGWVGGGGGDLPPTDPEQPDVASVNAAMTATTPAGTERKPTTPSCWDEDDQSVSGLHTRQGNWPARVPL